MKPKKEGNNQNQYCQICIQSACGSRRGVNDIQQSCKGYEPDPDLIEYWRDGKLIIKQDR